jgi:hypothetical protein
MKTVTVAFQMRIPKKMNKKTLEQFIRSAIAASRLISDSEQPRLYKNRIETFLP